MGVRTEQEPCFAADAVKRQGRRFVWAAFLVSLVGIVIGSPAAQAAPPGGDDSGGPPLLLARSDALSDAELAAQGAKGVGASEGAALPAAQQPRVILWDELGRPALQPLSNLGTTTLNLTTVP